MMEVVEVTVDKSEAAVQEASMAAAERAGMKADTAPAA